MNKLRILLSLIFLFSWCFPGYAVDQFDKTKPAGSNNASDIDTLVQTNNEALDRMLYNYRRDATVFYDSANTIKVNFGELAIPNFGGTVVKWRKNTVVTSVSWSDIDTSSEAISTQYYVYALADTDAATFTIKISASSSSPSGATYYRKIGYFYNDSSGNIISVGNVAGGDVRNTVQVTGSTDISTSSTSYTDMTDMVLYFLSSGRPAKLIFSAPMSSGSSNVDDYVTFDVDGTDYGIASETSQGGTNDEPYTMNRTIIVNGLSAGIKTIKMQWKNASGSTTNQYGSTRGPRVLIAEEL